MTDISAIGCMDFPGAYYTSVSLCLAGFPQTCSVKSLGMRLHDVLPSSCVNLVRACIGSRVSKWSLTADHCDTDPYPTIGLSHPEHYWNSNTGWIDGDLSRLV